MSQAAGAFVFSIERSRKGASMSIGRFLIGSALVFVGWMLMLSAVVTVVGLPIGLAVLALGLDLVVSPRRRGPKEKEA
jgi:hypothetical protein